MLKQLSVSIVSALLISTPLVHAATFNYNVKAHKTVKSNAVMNVPTLEGAGTALVNKEIKSFNNSAYASFKKTYGASKHANYRFDYKILTNTKQYLAVRVTSTLTAADEASTSKYFTIDKSRGQTMTLKYLFSKYSETNINKALKKKAKNTSFTAMDDETNFYMNKKNQLVVSFDEGTIAPYSAGTLTYTINVK
jgi:hypothetical protein